MKHLINHDELVTAMMRRNRTPHPMTREQANKRINRLMRAGKFLEIFRLADDPRVPTSAA